MHPPPQHRFTSLAPQCRFMHPAPQNSHKCSSLQHRHNVLLPGIVMHIILLSVGVRILLSGGVVSALLPSIGVHILLPGGTRAQREGSIK